MSQKRRKGWLEIILVVILLICCTFWYRYSRPINVEQNRIITLDPIVLQGNIQKIELGDNIPSDTEYQNTSFEYLIYDRDKFAYSNGYRPFPWGGEIFQGTVIFQNSSDSHSGSRAFKIIGLSSDSQGVVAVPDIELKPEVIPGEIYYVSFWIKYNIEQGKGVRIIQQFFKRGDYYYPTYASFGPWLKGKCDEWIHIGMLVRAPDDAWKGDPVIELYGKGELIVDDAYFGRVVIQEGGD